jgi:hypothetical protein
MASHYILLRNSDDEILEEADSTRFRKTGVPPTLKSEKGIRWLDLVVVNPAQGVDKIKEGPTVDITDTTYTRTWTVRDKTAEELDLEKDGEVLDRLRILNPLIKALNDGSFVPDSDYTVAQMKTILKAKL